MDKDKDTRLGSDHDWFEILEHPVFADKVDLEEFENKKVPAPFIPDVSEDITKYFDNKTSADIMEDTFVPEMS